MITLLIVLAYIAGYGVIGAIVATMVRNTMINFQFKNALTDIENKKRRYSWESTVTEENKYEIAFEKAIEDSDIDRQISVPLAFGLWPLAIFGLGFWYIYVGIKSIAKLVPNIKSGAERKMLKHQELYQKKIAQDKLLAELIKDAESKGLDVTGLKVLQKMGE